MERRNATSPTRNEIYAKRRNGREKNRNSRSRVKEPLNGQIQD